jgi:hypothetical protein
MADGITLLQEARAVGLVVVAMGDQLRIRGPRRAEPIAKRLIAHKADVLKVLKRRLQAEMSSLPDPPDGASPNDLSGDWWVLWDERAAIMEYDGGLPREQAEAKALAEILLAMKPRVEG